MSADILDRDALADIRGALLIGLSSFGEIERLINAFKLSEGLPEDIRPTHPTGSSNTITEFADALRLVQLAYDSAKSGTPGKAGGLVLLAPQRGKKLESPEGDITRPA